MISVVITAFNEEDSKENIIKELYESVSKQTNQSSVDDLTSSQISFSERNMD